MSTPAEVTAHSAVEKRWCHLNTLMTIYAVEPLLVADSVVYERFIKPPTTFDSRVFPDKMVLLIFQQLNKFAGNQRFQGIHQPFLRTWLSLINWMENAHVEKHGLLGTTNQVKRQSLKCLLPRMVHIP